MIHDSQSKPKNIPSSLYTAGKEKICPVVLRKDEDESRIPQVIIYVELENNEEDAGHCRPVIQRITYVKLKDSRRF